MPRNLSTFVLSRHKLLSAEDIEQQLEPEPDALLQYATAARDECASLCLAYEKKVSRCENRRRIYQRELTQAKLCLRITEGGLEALRGKLNAGSSEVPAASSIFSASSSTSSLPVQDQVPMI